MPDIAPAAERPGVAVPARPPSQAETEARRNSLTLRWLQFGAVVGLLLTAGTAAVAGAPPFLWLGLSGLGLVALLIWARAFHLESRIERARSAEQATSRRDLEALADRIWELQESEERFRGLIDALGDIVLHRDRQGKIVYANRVLAQLLGTDQQSLIGKSLAEIGIDIGVVPDAAFIEGEHLSSADVVIHTANGERWFSWVELSVRDESSNAISHRAVARDITARKRAENALISARERAENASRAKSRFLATVSHEIRTPMNGIMGMAKLLADTKLSPEQQTYVAAVSTSASALIALIEDLLDFSKIEVGRFELDPQPVRIRELIENVVELLASRAHAKGIGIGSYISPMMPETVTVDAGRLRQVLLNLVGNAIKFTDTGGVSVQLAPGDDATMTISVRDTGPGIPAADLERIFLDFEQVDGSSTRRHGGAGLGLAISRRIVNAMEGTIQASSEPGRGSEFRLEIPLLTDAASVDMVHSPLSGQTALIVSPQALEAEAIAATMRSRGAAAFVVPEVASIPEDAAFEGFDFVLVDASVENDIGETLAFLRDRDIAFGKAVSLIAPAERGMLGALRAGGYQTFLIRPVRTETLIKVLLSDMEGVMGGYDAAAASTAESTVPDRSSVLIAEDNAINALLAKSALGKAGYDVEVVSTGRAAVDAVKDNPAIGRFALILMDLHMPVLDGLDAITEIRGHEYENGLSPVPILVLSADSQETTRHLVMSHGATDFLVKPLDPHLLVEAVREHIG